MASQNSLQVIREGGGVTRTDLSRVSGVSTTTIRKIENALIKGKVETKRRLLLGLTEITGIEYDYKKIFP